MRRVIVESPFAGRSRLAMPFWLFPVTHKIACWIDRAGNEIYARAALADCLARGEAPFASHLLYTQAGVLDDGKPEERRKGTAAGLAWGDAAAATVVYVDRGITCGMEQGIDHARRCGRPVEFRSLRGKRAKKPALTDAQRKRRTRLEARSHQRGYQYAAKLARDTGSTDAALYGAIAAATRDMGGFAPGDRDELAGAVDAWTDELITRGRAPGFAAVRGRIISFNPYRRSGA